MTKTEFDKVDLKLSQARSHLASLRDTESSDAFYLTVNAFLAASRSVLSVLSYQFGLKELSPSQQGKRVRASLSPSQKVERQRFDAWMASAGAAALAHPLREERDESAHRSGQTGFGYHPKPGPGIVLHSGNAFQPARVLYAMGRAGLPMSDRNTFSYGMDDGSQVDAIAVCQDWLSMIEDLVTTARSRPWPPLMRDPLGSVASSHSRKKSLTSERTMGDDIVKDRQRWSSAPYFIVDDVVSTANYYRDKLGFHYERFWNDPPSFCMVKRNGVVIMLAQLETAGAIRPNHVVDPEGGAWDTYIWIDDADALNAEFKAKGVKIARDICDQPYGCRDFDIEDCNGYRICFGQDLEG